MLAGIVVYVGLIQLNHRRRSKSILTIQKRASATATNLGKGERHWPFVSRCYCKFIDTARQGEIVKLPTLYVLPPRPTYFQVDMWLGLPPFHTAWLSCKALHNWLPKFGVWLESGRFSVVLQAFDLLDLGQGLLLNLIISTAGLFSCLILH
jgi:hypothetical protein